MPWDLIDEIYAKKFKNENPDGCPPIPSRMAFGQYFLGLTEFNPKPLFESAMLSQIANRFTKEDMKRINEELYRPEVK